MKLIIILIMLLASPAIAKDVPMTWDHDCTNATGFRVYRSQGSSHWPELVGTVDCPATEFTDLNVPYGDLEWIVTAYNENGESTASNAVELAYYYGIVIFDPHPTSGLYLYKGENANRTATFSETTWVITKFFYTEAGSLLKMETRDSMSWDNRATGW